jgi:hypothetical protein
MLATDCVKTTTAYMLQSLPIHKVKAAKFVYKAVVVGGNK